ncbi:MAG: rhodanese-like domain-containing protein [Oscillospiraceae bacterium]|nr:rhodanese-like domain-containing protein [Oscillospiraceae bacterium]
MGLFDFAQKPDINEGVKTCAATPGAMLLDVRNPDEYAGGHIPGSVNLPLSEIRTAEDRIPDLDTPLFVYCLSGARSSRAVAELQSMGYANLCNLGGISKWSGEIEK